MKVLVISHTYIAPINREKWKVLANKFPELEIKVLIPKIWPATLFKIEAGDIAKDNLKNCEFVAFDTFKTGNEVLYGYNFLSLIKLLKSFNPNVIHVEQGDNACSYFQAIFLSKIFCSKAIFSFFTWVNWKTKRSLKYKLFWSLIEKFNLFFSDGAIVGNAQAGKILREKKFKKPIQELLQLGVNENFFYPVKKVENKKKYIGYIGRIIEEKGVFLLAEAFAKLIDEFSDWNLIFIGDGKAKSDLIDFAYKNNLEDCIEFKAAIGHEQVAQALQGLDIFVLPSYDTLCWREQFGHVLIEAMSCKIPVIGSTGGYIAQVIEDAGLIFEQKNIQELTNCLKRFMQDKNLRISFGQRGYQRFCQNYSYDIIAQKTYSFWRELK